MISRIRKSVFIRFFWGFIALYLLNISVDAPDQLPGHFPEDLSFNDQESIVELVVEKLLGFENAIAECNDNDAEEHNSQGGKKITLYFPFDKSDSQPFLGPKKQRHPDFEHFLTNGFHQLDVPPPKA